METCWSITASLGLGGVTLFKIGEVKLPINFNLTIGGPRETVFIPLPAIGPFETRFYMPIDKEYERAEEVECVKRCLGRAIEKLKPIIAEQGAPLALIIIGSADKRPLTSGSQRDLGGNSGLARRRAEWVKTSL